MKLLQKVKTIVSRNGEVHFERWAIIETKWFAWYLHKIQKPDQDHMHSHPWNFISLILKGRYIEEMRKRPSDTETCFNLKKPFKIAFFDYRWFHSIREIVESPIWTTVFVWGGSFEGDKWHYFVDAGDSYYKIPFDEYRGYKTIAKEQGIPIKQYLDSTERCQIWLWKKEYASN